MLNFQIAFCLSLVRIYKVSGEVHLCQSCPILYDPMDCNPPDSSVCGIFQPRTLEWVAISFSRRYSWPRDQTHVSWISWLGRWILYHQATWEAQVEMYSLNLTHQVLKRSSVYQPRLGNLNTSLKKIGHLPSMRPLSSKGDKTPKMKFRNCIVSSI